MPVTIESSRFGVIEIADEGVIEFPHGLIGLTGSRYALVAKEEDSAFLWLHSLDDPTLALAVTNPFQFFANYEVSLSDSESARTANRPAYTILSFTSRAHGPTYARTCSA